MAEAKCARRLAAGEAPGRADFARLRAGPERRARLACGPAFRCRLCIEVSTALLQSHLAHTAPPLAALCRRSTGIAIHRARVCTPCRACRSIHFLFSVKRQVQLLRGGAAGLYVLVGPDLDSGMPRGKVRVIGWGVLQLPLWQIRDRHRAEVVQCLVSAAARRVPMAAAAAPRPLQETSDCSRSSVFVPRCVTLELQCARVPSPVPVVARVAALLQGRASCTSCAEARAAS